MPVKATKQQLLLLGLLVASGAGWAADQYLFAAEPAGSTSDEFAVARNVAGAGKPLVPITPERRLASRLATLAGPMPDSIDTLRDLFSPVGPAKAPVELQPAEEAPAEAQEPAIPPAWASRSLNGVLFGADGKGVAIVDGRMIPVGARFDGLRLARVTKQIAVFTDGKTEITLHLREK